MAINHLSNYIHIYMHIEINNDVVESLHKLTKSNLNTSEHALIRLGVFGRAPVSKNRVLDGDGADH